MDKGKMIAVVAALLLTACAGEQGELPPELWIQQELGTRAEFQDLFFLDEQRGFIVGGGINIQGGILGRTDDGGRTWKFDSGLTSPSGRATSFHLNGVWFVNERTGFIVGDGFQILRTRDGGEHWHRISSGRVWAHLRDLQFVDDQYGWAIGSGGMVRTEDGGETWRGPLKLDPDAKKPQDAAGQAVSFVDRYRGWLVGRHGLIRYSNDGGESWVVQEAPESEKPHLWGVDFVNYNEGWAVGEGGTILHTADGGKSWERQNSSVLDTLMDVAFIDRKRGWVVGFERTGGTAVVLWTTDGGTAWSTQARVGSEEIRSIFVLDERHAWAVGRQQRRGPDDRSQQLLRYEVASAD